MKQEINPIALVGIIIVVVAVIAVFGFRAMRPAPYEPSPGVVHTSGHDTGATPGAVQASSETTPTNAPDKNAYYPAAPTGSIPGKPVNSGQ